MATHEFYSTENHHNERQIRILSVGSLVSKPPTKEKRISIKARMPLTGQSCMGEPEWIEKSSVFVGTTGDTVTPNIEFKGYSIELSTENLFGEPVQANNCIMRAFEIAEFGDTENPDVILSLTLRFPFSTKLWNWLGQYVGDDVWAKFVPGEAGVAQAHEEDGTELDDGENDEDLDPDNEENAGDDPELDTPIELEYEEPAGKSGPSNLVAFHHDVVEAEQKRGRGRPRKTQVDPLTVNSISTAF